jgi:glycosyltransferase involved in cell wall biosynthesis
MHRSGTSAVARLLMLLGADPPKRLMPPDSSNATGHWEPLEMISIHDEIFRSVSSWWDDVAHLPATWVESASAREFQHRAVEQLREDYGESRLFVVKDPRMCRTIPFWRLAFAEYGAQPSYVIVIRHPIEVANSLKARDGMNPARSLLLYLRDMLAVERETRDSPRVFVSYEQTLSDWRSVAQRISDRLDVTWPSLTHRTSVEVERFLSNKHRHNVATREDLSGRPEIVDWVQSAYSILQRAAESDSEPDQKGLDAIRAVLDDADLAYGPILAEAEVEAETKGSELHQASAEVNRLSEELEVERKATERLEGWIQQLESSRSWRITRPLRELGALIRRLLRRPVTQPEPPTVSGAANPARITFATPGHPSPANPPIGAGVGPTASQQSLIAWIEHLENSRSWRITRPLRDLGVLVRGGKPEERGDLTRLSEQELVDWIREMEGSRSWRITRPLRDLGALLRRLLGRPTRQPEPPTTYAVAGPAPSKDPARPGRTNPVSRASRPGPNRTVPRYPSGSAQSPTEPLVRGDADEHVAEIRSTTEPDPAFEDFDPKILAGRTAQAKLIAFYLPQFHSIPENDEWWGKGFTDWRNVARGTPRFAGHYQPRIPGGLGYYDLSDPRVMPRQIELARGAGIHGFSFYYYSFGDKRLLERPLEQFLADRSLDFPFCLTWANENWTRRWDGLDEETLIRQDHRPDDDVPLVDDLQRHFTDPRYIRLDGRPLFLVYRFDVLRDARETVARWRELWRERHGENPLIFLVQSFEDDPRPYGADGAVEFPPQRLARWEHGISDEIHFFDPEFAGYVIDYESLVTTAIERQRPPYDWVRGVTPSWDNDARKQGAGTIIHGSTPELYERWLASVVDAAQENPVLGEPMVFINAWNEWAEGAYLEPDVHYGAAYLNATARAVCRERSDEAHRPPAAKARPPEKAKVLLVGHDAHQHGAQLNLRELGDRLTRQFGCEVAYLLFEGGPLTVDCRRQGEVHICEDPARIGPIARRLRKRGYTRAVVNTLAAAEALPPLKKAGFQAVSLVSELPGIIKAQGLEPAAELVARDSRSVVFPAAVVAESFSEFAQVPSERTAILPQGLFRERRLPSASAVEQLRRELGIPGDARVVLNVGYADQRKGIDLFLETASRAAANGTDLHFVWLGNLNAEALELRAEVERSEAGNVHFASFTEDISPYLALADAFFLSSREDPFPSVVVEAMDAGLPVVAFRDSGGSEPLAEEHGALVGAEDVPAALEALRRCASEGDPAAAEARRRVVRESFQYDVWAFDVLRLLNDGLKKVSVVVPNYNYVDQLGGRLDSIFGQTHPIFELIVLDDASTDGSLGRLAEIREETGRRFRVIPNAENSGSVFRQWSQACEVARGDFLWIAEADDQCRPDFLERLMRDMHEGVAFTFSDSAQIDQKGALLEESYQEYYRRAANGLMQNDFVLDGDQFVRSCLAERNLVLNVSAVVWNLSCLRQTLDRCIDELLEYDLAGDWHLYAATALSGKRVAYVSDPLNIHRRHGNGVTSSLDRKRHLEEVRRVHSSLRDWLPADADTEARMESYEAELEQQFGLGS